jgi:hypothetical protein
MGCMLAVKAGFDGMFPYYGVCSMALVLFPLWQAAVHSVLLSLDNSQGLAAQHGAIANGVTVLSCMPVWCSTVICSVDRCSQQWG